MHFPSPLRIFTTTAVLLLSHSTLPGSPATTMTIPADFPTFHVPGHEEQMEQLRQLYWLHYPGSSPKATMWDEWLPSASLWPAMDGTRLDEQMRAQWRKELSSRIVDPEGYVASHQHASIAHQTGWPFPAHHQGHHVFGWHFSFKDVPGLPWRPENTNDQTGWMLTGARDAGIDESGWNLKLTAPDAVAVAPHLPHPIDPFESPFIQIRWSAKGLRPDVQPYVEWTTSNAPDFRAERRMYFDPPSGKGTDYTMIPMWRHPNWTGEVIGLRIGFGNEAPGAEINLRAFFSQYDTRHNINNFVFPIGSATYFNWTRDLSFLRNNIQRMRTAIRYGMNEFRTPEEKLVLTPWVGHDADTGLRVDEEGTKAIVHGQGIGNNYWDLLPFGHKDTYATIRLYHALNVMADLEEQIDQHPEWNMPGGFLKLDPEALRRHAAEVKEQGNRVLWNEETGRFAISVTASGQKPDFGLTFLNLEAIYYDFATPEHARQIMDWIAGERVVATDTAQTTDIYNWRFGPRATTKRNVEYYMWVWNGPESLAWGGQVQDGGAVLGFSYHDLMARLKMRGADDAWNRLQEILAWFGEVQAAGGYRGYYDGTREGTLQGGGPPGGLGMDQEFFESVLVPQVMLNGFLGFSPAADGFRIAPNLPTDWPELAINRIHFHDLVLSIRATSDSIEIRREEGESDEPRFIRLGEGNWEAAWMTGDNGNGGSKAPIRRRESDGAFEVLWGPDSPGVRFTRTDTKRETADSSAR